VLHGNSRTFTDLSRLYMFDGLYQSAICYFMAYLLFAPATFETESGRGVADRNRMGVYAACVSILVINSYILLNTYKWDWIMVLITSISILLIWAWTGIYSSFEASFQFYRAGQEVYGTLTFWALTLLIWVICLLPRFSIKFFQKYFRPLDVDVIREQVRQGKFDYLNSYEAYVPPKLVDSSGTSSDQPEEIPADASKAQHLRYPSTTESQRPIYPPSEAPTRDTKPPHSQTGSDGTDKTRPSLDVNRMPHRADQMQSPNSPTERLRARPPRPSLERVRSSFERSRQSFERGRISFEASRDFTSAAYLTRMESSHSHGSPITPTVTASRRRDITADLREGQE
jgi:phospholipid-translocating ATPase